MIKNNLSVRQICVIMCVFNAAIKLMLYPTTMAAACGNALWLPVVVDTALQTACVWAVCMLCSKTDKTFFELLSAAAGKWTARIVFVLFAIYFVLCTVVPMTEQQAMVHEVFYDTIPSLLVFLPFFFFAVYAGGRGLTNAGRTAEVCLPIFIVTAATLVIMGLVECDFSALLPFLRQPFSQLVSGCAGGFFRFNEGSLMLLFMGNFKYKKGDAAKISLSCAIGGLIVAAVCAVFYAVYSDLASQQYFAITKISIFFSAVSLTGRTGLIAVYALALAVLFAIVLNVQLAVYCLVKATGRQWHPAFTVGVNAVLIAITFVLNNKFALAQVMGSRYMGWITLAFAYVMPAVGWIVYAAGGKKREKN